MRIFRTIQAVLDNSMRQRVLDAVLFNMLVETCSTPFTLDDLSCICADPESVDGMLEAVVALLDEGILSECCGMLVVVQSDRAQVEAGLFTDDSLDLVPEGVEVFDLAVGIERLVVTDKTASKLAERTGLN